MKVHGKISEANGYGRTLSQCDKNYLWQTYLQHHNKWGKQNYSSKIRSNTQMFTINTPVQCCMWNFSQTSQARGINKRLHTGEKQGDCPYSQIALLRPEDPKISPKISPRSTNNEQFQHCSGIQLWRKIRENTLHCRLKVKYLESVLLKGMTEYCNENHSTLIKAIREDIRKWKTDIWI